MRILRRQFAPAALLLGALACFAGAATELGYSRSVTPGLVKRYTSQFGGGVPERIAGWQEFLRRAVVQEGKAGGDASVLAPVNRFFNRVPSFTDQQHWNAEDYWATPAETLASNGADCEDYAIAKYFALKELGVPVSQLRLVYVNTWNAGPHMVLAYYPAPGAEPLILDNLDGGIRPARDRPDLTPVYSFNDDDIELMQANGPALRINPASNRKWAVVLQKLQREMTY